jgi:hypothetical protein
MQKRGRGVYSQNAASERFAVVYIRGYRLFQANQKRIIELK